MNQRFRITRAMQSHEQIQDDYPAISLQECRDYFATRTDFIYQDVLSVKGEESTMTIKGDFFMWKHGESLIPFRHYMGDLYVAVSHQELIPLMIEIAGELQADIIEG